MISTQAVSTHIGTEIDSLTYLLVTCLTSFYVTGILCFYIYRSNVGILQCISILCVCHCLTNKIRNGSFDPFLGFLTLKRLLIEWKVYLSITGDILSVCVR